MKNQEKIFVIGHKNPDTDSICSAIAYANLKNQVEGNGYEAYRAGNINGETRYVLDTILQNCYLYVTTLYNTIEKIGSLFFKKLPSSNIFTL